GCEKHVGFFDSHEPFDRGSVEHDVAGERLLELGCRELDILVDSENVRELQSQESNIVGLGQLEDVVGGSTRSIGDLGAMSRHRLNLALRRDFCKFCNKCGTFLAS